MKTSQVKSYYERYMYAVSKHGYRGIFDCFRVIEDEYGAITK